MACLSLGSFVGRTGRSPRSVAEESMVNENLVPTLCEHGCQVEIHAVCPHGCHSIAAELMRAGHTWKELSDLRISRR